MHAKIEMSKSLAQVLAVVAVAVAVAGLVMFHGPW